MKPQDLPPRWQNKLKEYLDTKNSIYDNLGAGDFPSNKAIKLVFPDGSTAQFNYAMLLEAPELKEIALFTEHCGYHIFSDYGLEITEVTLPYTIPDWNIIDYPAEKLRGFYGYMYEWVDNLHFALSPADVLKDATPYLKIASEQFKKLGWWGDGEIQLMWIPPFAQKPKYPIDEDFDDFYNGITVWHVKQLEDGLSWILSPVELPFA